MESLFAPKCCGSLAPAGIQRSQQSWPRSFPIICKRWGSGCLSQTPASRHIVASPLPASGDRLHRVRSRCSPAKSGDAGKVEVDPMSLEAAAIAVETIWTLARERDMDELLRFVPDHVLDATADLRPSAMSNTPLTFNDIVGHSHDVSGFTFDSFAQRHLYHSPPTRGSVTRLSCIRTAPERAVLRYGVTADGGEQAVLTFGVEGEERLVPHYRAIRIEYVWQLTSVSGEPRELPPEQVEEEGEEDGASSSSSGRSGSCTSSSGRSGSGEEHACRPHPSLPPEAVVQAQLAALLREDTATAFAFASPANKAITGPLERFTELLQNPLYRPLLRHRTAISVQRTTGTPDSYTEVVKVVSDNTGMPHAIEGVYVWELSRQPRNAADGSVNCWMTDSVSLVVARAL